MRSNIFRICPCPVTSDLCSYGQAQVVTESHLIVTRLVASSGQRGRESHRSRAHRDKVNAKVMSDPRMNKIMGSSAMPFDIKRMTYGGFEYLVNA